MVKLNIEDITLAITVLTNSLNDIVIITRKISSKLNIKLSITHDANELSTYFGAVLENVYLKITLYIFIESLTGLKCVDAFSSIYTVLIGTSIYGISDLLNSKSILVSYSKRSPSISQKVWRYLYGIALSPVCVSDMLSPHIALNTKLVRLLPNLLLNGTSSPSKVLTPSTTLSSRIIASQQLYISSA